ncbi:MAG: chain length determinant protein EpsF [Burkholderiales bacterium]
MSFHQFLRVIWARKWLALLVMILTVGVTAAISRALPKYYTAQTSILVDFKGADPVTGVLPPFQMVPQFLATQVDVIASRRVALQVVDMLRLAEMAAARAQFVEATKGQGEIRDWLADQLLRRLEVRPSRESSVVQLSYTAQDPKFAALIVNTMAEAYLRTTLELKVEPARHNATWFDQQIKSLRENLENAQARLTAFQRSNAMLASDERFDVETARLNELSTQLISAQSASIDATARRKEAESLQRNSGTADGAPEIVANSLVQSLKTELTRADMRLTEYREKMGEEHPRFQRAKAERDGISERLEREIRIVASSLGSHAASSIQREAELRRAVAAQKSKLLQLRQTRDDAVLLAREVDTAQKVYDAAQQRHDHTLLESRTTQTNVTVLNPAVAPIEPSSPKVLLNTVLAGIMGALLALAATVVVELSDRRARAPGDIVEVLGMAVLGDISVNRHPKERLALPTTQPALAG